MTAAVPAGMVAVVITASNRAARGEREDSSGRLAVQRLRALGFVTTDPTVVPDDVAAITAAVRASVEAGAAVVITTGGTGVTPTDVTPEATRPLLDREIPGIAEAIRLAARDRVPTSVLSRGLAGVAERTLVVNLPGSPGGVRDGFDVLDPILGHVLDQIRGGDHVQPGASGATAPVSRTSPVGAVGKTGGAGHAGDPSGDALGDAAVPVAHTHHAGRA